jgi:hypothetical protein
MVGTTFSRTWMVLSWKDCNSGMKKPTKKWIATFSPAAAEDSWPSAKPPLFDVPKSDVCILKEKLLEQKKRRNSREKKTMSNESI